MRELVDTTTPSVLEQMRKVVATVPVGHTTLLDLFGNKGTADPILIACALDAGLHGESELLPDTWVIVTSDRAVIQQATEFGVATRSPSELADIIDVPIWNVDARDVQPVVRGTLSHSSTETDDRSDRSPECAWVYCDR